LPAEHRQLFAHNCGGKIFVTRPTGQAITNMKQQKMLFSWVAEVGERRRIPMGETLVLSKI
jgi:hypothetical protein